MSTTRHASGPSTADYDQQIASMEAEVVGNAQEQQEAIKDGAQAQQRLAAAEATLNRYDVKSY